MAAEPSEAEISSFRDLCGVSDVDEIKARLRANNGDLEGAIGDYFDGSKKYIGAKNNRQWDEIPFAMNRDGTEQMQQPTNPSFRIDAVGDDVARSRASVAPSRPPSRANSRTPVSNHGTIERWQQNSTSTQGIWQNPSDSQRSATPNHNFPVNAADEDADMQRAIEASRLDAGMPPQESGLTSVSNVNEVRFGPANRPDAEYEPDQWALVPSIFRGSAAAANIGPVASNSTAVYEESVSSRIRKAGAPAFIMSAGAEKMPPLASILTILHEIPAARNALLGVGQPAPKYFHHPDWWKGTAVDDPLRANPLHHVQELAEEIHRLMAFLDSTERSYGCIDPLRSTNILQSEPDDLKGFGNFIQSYIPPNLARNIFSQVVEHFRARDPPTSSSSDDSEIREVVVVEYNPSQFSGDGFPPVLSLYDILNMVMWHQFIMNPKDDSDALACIREPGEVITFRWQGPGLENDVEIPEIIYIDRYLEANVDGAKAIQEGICAAAERLAAVKKLKEDVYMELLPNDKKVPKVEHYDRMIERCEVKLAAINEDAAWRAADAKWKASRDRQKNGIEPTKEDLDPEQYKPRLTEAEEQRKIYWEKELCMFQSSLERCLGTIKHYEASVMVFESIHSLVTDRYTGSNITEMKGLLAHIKKQLAGTVGADNAACAIQHFESLFPGILDIDSWNDPRLTCKRMLRGVAVGGKIVYVCRRSLSLEDMNEEGEGLDIWWKLEYREDEAEPVQAEVVDEMIVRVAAGKTKDQPILVYASPDALNMPSNPLSEALSFFVKADNHVFRNEIMSGVPSQQQTVVQDAPQSITGGPSKRKYSSCSMDSNATNHASCGSNSDIGDAPVQRCITSPFFSAEDVDADTDIRIVHSTEGTPLGALSSAIDSPRDTSGSDLPSATRRRKGSDSRDPGGDSEHIEYHNSHSRQAQSPPLEMQSRGLIPMIGMAGGDKQDSLRQESSDVDMNIDMHEHND